MLSILWVGAISMGGRSASFLLDEARVAVVPGAAFGQEEGVRISYATSMERIQEGVARMAAAVKKL